MGEDSASTAELSSTNGFRYNGFRYNGFRYNGFRYNGFRYNGFRYNGLQAPPADFNSWFNGISPTDAANSGNFMKYFIGCALPASQTFTYKDAYGTAWSWQGGLGLAPGWGDASKPITVTEDQLVTACLAAHINTALPNPKSVQISLRGDHPSLAVSEVERSALSTFDGVFFGNAFQTTEAATKLYLCAPKAAAPANYVQGLLSDWGRDCYLSNDGCDGLFTIVDCNTACGPGTDGSPFGTTCTAEGKTYKAISVRVPKIKKAADFTVAGGVAARDCASCLGGKALNGFGATVATATATGMTTPGGAGNYTLELRYINNSTAAANLTIQINGQTLMNGTNPKFSFPPSGTTIKSLTIPVTLPGSASLKLAGANSPLLSIESAVLRIR